MYYLSGAVIFSVILSIVVGQEYTAVPLSMEKCLNFNGKGHKYEIKLNEEADGSKSFSLNSDLATTINEGCTYSITVDIKSGIQYVRYMQADGSFCEGLTNIMKPAWDRFKLAVNPPIKESCLINPGSYSIKNFKVKKDELNAPIPSEGQFKVDTHVFCGDEEIACVLAEFEVTEDDE